MADLIRPYVDGRISIEFSEEALTKLNPAIRNEYLNMVRIRLSDVLESCRMESNMINNWMIELYEHE